jgi:hypothetical protein
VTVRARSATRREGTRLHLTTRPVEATMLDLLPLTTPARTLLDLASVVATHDVEAAAKQASALEDRFRALCDARGLPHPAVNARPLGFRVDFLWPAARLVVETDGWGSHRTRAARSRRIGRAIRRSAPRAIASSGSRTGRSPTDRRGSPRRLPHCS